MNTAKAIEFASDNNITVSDDKTRRLQLPNNCWRWLLWFNVGERIVEYRNGATWRTQLSSGAAFTGRRGECIAACVRDILDKNSDEASS